MRTVLPKKMSVKMRQVCVAAIAVVMALTIVACGSGGGNSSTDPTTAVQPIKSVPCHGQPVVVGTITSLGGPKPENDVMGGVEAAAKAVNEECAAGRPLKLVTCNDNGDPSQAADCGRQIVSSGAIALVGASSIASGSFEPIVEGEGIPSIGNGATDITELAATTSFPFYNGLARIAAHCATHAAAGATGVSIIVPESPAIQAQFTTMEEVCESFHVKVDRFVQVPIEATDLAQYASQAAESESIIILTDSKEEGLLHELETAGITPENTVITAPALEEDEVEEAGEKYNGLLMPSPTMPLSETSNKGVAEYLSQTQAAGVSDHGVDGMIAWRAMHVTAELIKKLPKPSSKSLIKAIEGYSFAPPEAAPVNFTKPAFPEIPVFEQFRVFSRDFALWVVKDGKIALAKPGFIDPSKSFKLE